MDLVKERLKTPYSERAKTAKNTAAKKLFELMEKKETNLALAADFYDPSELVRLIRQIGPKIAVLKMHMDLMNFPERDYMEKLELTIFELREASEDYDFLIFEDRKFADIGGISKRQYNSGIFKIVDWAHLVNAHVFPGPGVITGLQEGAQPYVEKGKLRGLILLPYMTPDGNLFNKDIAQQVMDMGKKHSEFVMGWIGAGKPEGCLEHVVEQAPRETLIMTPGCQLPGGESDNIKHGQVYTDPENLISRGSDINIVGSGIYKSKDPVEAAEVYRKAGWDAYKTRLGGE